VVPLGRAQIPAANQGDEIRWVEASYTAIHHVLTNPIYAGAYAYGKTRQETTRHPFTERAPARSARRLSVDFEQPRIAPIASARCLRAASLCPFDLLLADEGESGAKPLVLEGRCDGHRSGAALRMGSAPARPRRQ
jgi:Recombinase